MWVSFIQSGEGLRAKLEGSEKRKQFCLKTVTEKSCPSFLPSQISDLPAPAISHSQFLIHTLMVPFPWKALTAAPGNLLEMYILRPRTRPTESNTLGVRALISFPENSQV